MISDIVQEMRQHTRCSAADAFYTPASWAELCDRLEREEAKLIADRDNWRQQALTEDERANREADIARECAYHNIVVKRTFAICQEVGDRMVTVAEAYSKERAIQIADLLRRAETK